MPAIVGTWSYSGDPTDSTRDELRFTIGDTNETAPLMGDAELDYLLTASEQDVPEAAIAAIRRLIFRWAGYVNKSVEGLSISYGDLSARYKSLLDVLITEAQESSGVPVPWSPLTQEQKREWDLGLGGDPYDSPYFTLAMEDSPRVGGP